MKEPNDKILDVLLHIAKLRNRTKEMRGFDKSRKRIYDIEASGHLMVKDFFDGNLGKSMLDQNLINADDQKSSSSSQIDLNSFVVNK